MVRRSQRAGLTGSMASVHHAHALYQQGMYSEAAKECHSIVDAPGSVDLPALLLLSACYFMLREMDLSLRYSQEAIAADPGFAEAYGNAGG